MSSDMCDSEEDQRCGCSHHADGEVALDHPCMGPAAIDQSLVQVRSMRLPNPISGKGAPAEGEDGVEQEGACGERLHDW